MARSRNIKPAFFTNEELGTLDPIINLTFIGLWCLADKEGILEDRPLRIKAELFPYRDSLDINGYLTVLAQLNFIERYEVDGKSYIHIVNFEKHQSPHHTEKAKGYPKKPKQNNKLQDLTVKHPLNNEELTVPERSDSLIHDSLIPEINTIVADATSPSSKTEDGIPDCPHQKILTLYKRSLPELPYPKDWSGARASALKSRWVWVLKNRKLAERTEECGLNYFERMFDYIAQSDFLTGRTGTFSASLDWICKNENFLKIIEGKYENRKAVA